MNSGIDSGYTYRFKISAHNYIGESAQSSAGSVIAATEPDALAAAPTKLSSTKDTITIQWSEPYSGGSPITGY